MFFSYGGDMPHQRLNLSFVGFLFLFMRGNTIVESSKTVHLVASHSINEGVGCLKGYL